MAKVVALPAFKQAKTVSCYLSMPTAEVQTAALISNILADNGMDPLFCVALWGITRCREETIRSESHIQRGTDGLREVVR